MNIEINHHNVPSIKFRALGTHYPTGEYKQSFNTSRNMLLRWFVLVIDGIEITWYSDWMEVEEE